MQVELSYVFHNAFLLRSATKCLLFDFPDASFLQAGKQAAVADAVRGTDLVVFVSHSHKDHFTPGVRELGRLAARAHYVVSYDVADLFSEFDPEQGGCTDVTVIEPEAWAEAAGLRILGLESTDLGVGFLIFWEGKHIYFGGDVAEWIWEEADERAKDFSRKHFDRTLETLRPYAVDLAFSNADARLSNWTGAERFMHTVRPRFFVPMHTFGRLGTLRRFASEATIPPGVTLLPYGNTGFFAQLDL